MRKGSVPFGVVIATILISDAIKSNWSFRRSLFEAPEGTGKVIDDVAGYQTI